MQKPNLINHGQHPCIINDAEELKHHIHALIAIEPRFATAYEQVGIPDLRRNAGGFDQLMRAMVGQQLSVAAARSIWQRLEQAALTTPDALTAATDETLRTQGLSRQKIRYIRSLVEHKIDFAALAQMTDADVIQTLTQVVGIGRWTAQMYLLFSLGRSDVLAEDDMAIQEGARRLLMLTDRPTAKILKQLSASWTPHRSAASLLLWAYYGLQKDKVAIPV